MFKDDFSKFGSIQEHKMAIVAVEADLDDHLLEIRKMLKHSKLGYVTVAGIEVSDLKCWLMSSTSLKFAMRMLQRFRKIGLKSVEQKPFRDFIHHK